MACQVDAGKLKQIIDTRNSFIAPFFFYYLLYFISVVLGAILPWEKLRDRFKWFHLMIGRQQFFFIMALLLGHMTSNPGVAVCSFIYAVLTLLHLLSFLINIHWISFGAYFVQGIIFFIMMIWILSDTWCELFVYKFTYLRGSAETYASDATSSTVDSGFK